VGREAIGMGVTCLWVVLLQLPISAWLWRALPLLERVQFPWRFGIVLSMATAWLFACVLERWLEAEAASPANAPARSSQGRGLAERGVVAALVVWAVGMGFHAATARAAPATANWFDEAPLRERIVPEYLPPGVSVTDVAGWARSRPVDARAWTSAPASIEARPAAPGHRSFRVRADDEVDLVVATFAHPRWRASIDGRPAAIAPDSSMHLLRVALPPGDHEVDLEFGPGPVDTLASVVTGIGLLTLGGVALAARRVRGMGA
jgi:hypothetical protein